ncbi:MAG: 6,7-dimethyl-8-ribityllumazine synthase [Opitutae bacterium]|nr:6,7-dimethyl-8-ribityllumazine synthase [Opitutae bacterium]
MSLNAPTADNIDGAPFSIGLVAARYNGALIEALLDAVQTGLAEAGVKPRRLKLLRVPGSNELPVAAHWLARRGATDCVIALGVLIKGDTLHHRIVGQSVTAALQQVALVTRTPVINGVLVVETRKQAEARCTGRISRGAEFARAALEMAALKRRQEARP